MSNAILRNLLNATPVPVARKPRSVARSTATVAPVQAAQLAALVNEYGPTNDKATNTVAALVNEYGPATVATPSVANVTRQRKQRGVPDFTRYTENPRTGGSMPLDYTVKARQTANPSRPGTLAHTYYELIKRGGTVAEYVAAGGRQAYLVWFYDRNLADVLPPAPAKAKGK